MIKFILTFTLPVLHFSQIEENEIYLLRCFNFFQHPLKNEYEQIIDLSKRKKIMALEIASKDRCKIYYDRSKDLFKSLFIL